MGLIVYFETSVKKLPLILHATLTTQKGANIIECYLLFQQHDFTNYFKGVPIQARLHVPIQARLHVPIQARVHVPIQARLHVPIQARLHVPIQAGLHTTPHHISIRQSQSI
jgi:hypothetical protein